MGYLPLWEQRRKSSVKSWFEEQGNEDIKNIHTSNSDIIWSKVHSEMSIHNGLV